MKKTAFAIPALLIAAMFAADVGNAQTFRVQKYNIGGDGGTDYVTAEPGTGRVFVSRGTHVMVVDGTTGKVIGDIPDTPRMHGVGLVPKYNHGFTTNGGDSTVTMFDLKTLGVIKKIKIPTGGLDGIMYDDYSDHIILTNHSRPIGTAVALDAKTMKVLASWPLAPCDGPTGIAYDRSTNRIFSGCGNTSVVVDPATGKVVATIKNGDGVDALGFDASEKLIYIPAGRDSNVTVVRETSPNSYTVIATVPTMRGAKTITVDPMKHVAYLFQPEYGPAPVPAPGSPPPAPGSRPPRGPVIGAWFFVISH